LACFDSNAQRTTQVAQRAEKRKGCFVCKIVHHFLHAAESYLFFAYHAICLQAHVAKLENDRGLQAQNFRQMEIDKKHVESDRSLLEQRLSEKTAAIDDLEFELEAMKVRLFFSWIYTDRHRTKLEGKRLTVASCEKLGNMLEVHKSLKSRYKTADWTGSVWLDNNTH